jgi:hypothetical protein
VEVPKDLIHAAFFFVDIVGLSDPSMSTSTQTVKIKMLNKFIKESNVLKNSLPQELIMMPTGDGMFIGFIDGLEQPLKLAIEVQEKIIEYNKDKSTKSFEILEVRIGCHVGNVFLVEDVSGTQNVWGPGIIMARRVMDLGDAGHILMTSEMAEEVIEINEEYVKTIFPLHDYEIKHGQTILLYSMFSEMIGNPKRPKKGFIEKSKFRQALHEMKNDVRHTKVKLRYVLEDFKTNAIHHERNYQLINKIDEPIYSLINGIMTNDASSFNEIKLSVFDKNQQKMKIIGINVDTNNSKEFTFKLNAPIFSGAEGEYTISYNTIESQRTLENCFFIDSDELDVSFEFQTQHGLDPKIYYKKNNENEMILERTVKRKNSITQVLWVKKEIHSLDSIRLEW